MRKNQFLSFCSISELIITLVQICVILHRTSATYSFVLLSPLSIIRHQSSSRFGNNIIQSTPQLPNFHSSSVSLFSLFSSSSTDDEELLLKELGLIERDYLVTDSLNLSDDDRPSVLEFMFQLSSREGYLRLPLLLSGILLSLCNIVGYYDTNSYPIIALICIVLGFCNGIADLLLVSNQDVSNNIRRGAIDGKVLQFYAATYTLSVSWLALRVYPQICPLWLEEYDTLLGCITTSIFAGSLISPLLTIWSNYAPENKLLQKTQINLVKLIRGGIMNSNSTAATLTTNNDDLVLLPFFTPTEQFRAIGLLAIGFVACLYVPVSTYFALYGAPWWTNSLEQYPQQGILETGTTLFGLLAAQANICITKAAMYGVQPLAKCVKVGSFATFFLAIFPCVCALYYLQDGISFFDHYNYIAP